MEKKKIRRITVAGILAATTVLSAARYSYQRVDAAARIDLEQPCSITWNMDSAGSFSEDLKNVSVDVNVYKIADVSEERHFTDLEAFQTMEMEKLVTNTEASAEDWQAKAQSAKEIVDAQGVEADGEGVIQNGTLTMEGLVPGAYLVVMNPAQSAEYEYTFEPYLMLLPDNEYYHTQDATSDDWIYDVTANVKAERNPLYGNLQIIKTLRSYQEMLGEAMFVFQVEGQKDELVYSNVVAVTFSQGGVGAVTLEHIPAGMEVTVTEIYSGASYELTSAPDQSTVIVAEDVVNVEFSNDYTEKLVPGNGVVNHFDYDEEQGWMWNKQSEPEL